VLITSTSKDPLAKAINRVVKNDNCSGCGGCALISKRVVMDLDSEGFMRPRVKPLSHESLTVAKRQSEVFDSMCPGIRITAPKHLGAKTHSIFGQYFSTWEASAIDPVIRHAGSSGGVLTALSAWLLDTGQVKSMSGAGADTSSPSRTVSVKITTRDQALSASGSRYAPVATLTTWQDHPAAGLVAKPCEVSAAVQLHQATNSQAEMPITLSFFCAGTPSQDATDDLITSLGITPARAASVRYRGNGWPGRFAVESSTGEKASLTYDESWGNHLGRKLQWRCKTCVDGTGAHADISVGDLWQADANGYPTFIDTPGNSIAIARTSRGDSLLRAAAAAGIIALSPVDPDVAAAIQPLQRQRRTTILGRLAGRRISGHHIPIYRGYNLVQHLLRYPRENARALLGTFLRSISFKRYR